MPDGTPATTTSGMSDATSDDFADHKIANNIAKIASYKSNNSEESD